MSDGKSDLSAATGDPAFSQAEIDALLQNAAESGGAESAAGMGAIQQEDIDALLKAGGLPADAGVVLPDEKTSTSRTAPDDAESAVPPDSESFSSSPELEVPAVQSYQFEPLLNGVPSQVDPKRVSMLGDVNLRVKVQLGQTRMLVEEVLKLGEGSVVELDKLAGDPVDILVNDRLIARGEVLVLNDNFCVRVNEVLSNNPHRVAV